LNSALHDKMVKTDTLAGPEFNLEMPLGNCPEEGNPDEGIRSERG
jgi:hypothetical protein